MKESEIIAKWKIDQPIYLGWANFIRNEINSRLNETIFPIPLDYFLKVAATPRLKTESSLVDKALHRSKIYKDPYNNITDKVGIRYVVLLTSDIKKICNIIESAHCKSYWHPSKDKDYEE